MGSQDCRTDYLLSFLKHNKSEYLYLVGDFIDLWQLKRRWHWPQMFNNLIQKVLSKAKKGAKVIYIPGNHDEGLRSFVGAKFGGIQIAMQAIHETADGRRMLVLHGDEFDAVVQHNRWLAILGDAAYGYLITLNRMVNFVRRQFGMPYWSLSGYIKGRVKNAVRFITSFEEAVVHYAKKQQVAGVICGHIHQPTIKMLNGIQYCNTGDWIENCTAMVEHMDGRLELIHWMQTCPELAPHDFGQPDADDEELVLDLAAVATIA